MNKFKWTYIGENNKHHHVGLLHGPKSGHLVVYCNAKIILIDFEILISKTYSFFIEDELCELSIEEIDGLFYYGLKINKKADTPRNRGRKKIEKRHLMQSLLFIIGLGIIALSFSFGLKQWSYHKEKQVYQSELMNSNEETSAKVLFTSQNEKQVPSYFFIVNGKSYKTACEFPEDDNLILLENGMPLEPGDEFIVKYIAKNPRLSEIDFNRPAPSQVEAYKERAITKYLSLHPNTNPKDCTCMADITFEYKGIGGLADIYFLDVSPQKNPIHNENSFKRLMRDDDFQVLLKKKCDL